jgi:chromosome segregation ATPase
VLVTGAAFDAAQRYRRARHPAVGPERRPEPPRVPDRQAAGHLGRAAAAVARLEQARSSLGDVSSDLSADVDAKARGMLDALGQTGSQVDRLSEMLGAFDQRAVRAELADVEQALARDSAAGQELAEELRRTRDGLRAHLASIERLGQQRALMLERMRATAVGIEGLAVRVGEIGALYESSGRVDTTSDDLRSVTADLDSLRQGLMEAERSVRAVLSGTDIPGLDDTS